VEDTVRITILFQLTQAGQIRSVLALPAAVGDGTAYPFVGPEDEHAVTTLP
jgi:hypothetical protein